MRALTLQGNGFAQAVGLSAGSFAEQEQYVKDSIKIGVNSVNGNPHLTEDEVKDKSWDEIKHPDLVRQRRLERRVVLRGARERSKQTWKNTGYDVMDAQLDSMERSGLIDPKVRDAADAELREDVRPGRGDDRAGRRAAVGGERLMGGPGRLGQGDRQGHRRSSTTGSTRARRRSARAIDWTTDKVGEGLDNGRCARLGGRASRTGATKPASSLGAEVGEQQLGQTEEANELIHGNPDEDRRRR